MYKIKYSNRKNSILPKEMHSFSSDDYVLTNQEEMDILSRYILDYKNTETGGQLFGYWTFDGKPVVLFVLGPGPHAGHYNAFFMQDLNYLKKCARFLKQKYGLDHVGEWHSHHQLGLSYPSGHDARNISTNMRKLGYSKFLLCIGTCTTTESSINAFMFYSNKIEYEYVPWLIKDIESPFRKMMSFYDVDIFDLPETKCPNMGHLYLKGGSFEQKKINYGNSYWLKQKGNAVILKAIIDRLEELYPSQTCVPTIDENNEVHLEMYDGNTLLEDIHFPNAFPIESPVVCDAGGNTLFKLAKWNYSGDIIESFMSFYKSLKHNNYDEG